MRSKGLVLAILFLLAGGAAVLLLLARPYLTVRLRQRLEREIAAAAGTPMRIGELRLSLFPPAVSARAIALGAEPPIASAERVHLRLWTLASLAEGRPVLSAKIESVVFDPARLPKSQPPSGGSGTGGAGSVPGFRLREIALADARLRFPLAKATAELTVAHLAGHLEAAAAAQRLTGSVAATGVELHRGGRRVRVDEVRVDGGADAGGLFIDSASLQGDGITLSAHATGVAQRYNASSTLDLAHLAVIDDDLRVISGLAYVEGTVSGDLANPRADAQVRIERGAIAHRTLGELTAHATRDGTALHVDDLRLLGSLGELTGTADLTLAKEVPLRGQFNLQGADLDAVLRAVGQSLAISDRLNAAGTVNGSLDPLNLAIDGSGTLQVPAADGLKDAARVDVATVVRLHAVDVDGTLTQPEHNRLSAKIAVAHSLLAGTIDLSAADLAAFAPLLPAPVQPLALSGRTESRITLSGSTEQPLVEATVKATEVTVMGAPFSRIAGDVRVATDTVTSENLRIDTPNGGAQVSGVFALAEGVPNDWRLALHDLDTDPVLGLARVLTHANLPLSGGTLDGTLHCRGAWSRADLQIELAARSLRIANEPLDRIEVKASATWPRWSAHLGAVHAATETVTVDAAGEGSARWQVTLASTPVNLANFRDAARRHLSGTVAVHGQVSGEPLRPSGSLQVDGVGLGFRRHHLGDVALRVEGTQGDWSLRGNALSRALTLAATLKTTAALPYTLTAEWRDTDLAPAISADQSLHVTTSGDLTMSGSLRQPAAPSGSLHVTRFEARRDEYRVSAAEPIAIEMDSGRFRVDSLVLAAEASRLSVTGEGTTAGQIHLQARGEGDLVLLELIGSPVSSARGRFTVGAEVLHTPERGWDLRGDAAVRDAAFDVGLPVAFTDITGHLTLAGERIRIDGIDGKAGGGEFHLGGAVDVNRGPRLSWQVHEVALAMPESLELHLSGQGEVAGTWQGVTVGGDVEVVNALYDRNLELTDVLPAFTERVTPAPRTEAAKREVRLDLHLHAPDGLFIDNNVAKAELRADLRVTGSTERPVVNGTIEFVSAEVTFRKRVFTVTGGTVDFRDPFRINPLLNITAESQIATADAEYTVTVVVSGTAENPRVEFAADDPNLSQNDVLSLVTLGKTAAQVRREGGGVSAGDVLALLPTGGVQERVGKLVGVDRFEVESVQARDVGGFEPRVTIGKDLTDRLRALASTSFGVDARRAVQLEYRLSRRISLLGTWESATQQQAGAFGGDVKFRFEFRRLRFSLRGDDVR